MCSKRFTHLPRVFWLDFDHMAEYLMVNHSGGKNAVFVTGIKNERSDSRETEVQDGPRALARRPVANRWLAEFEPRGVRG